MKVSELKDLIKDVNDSLDVTIALKLPYDTITKTPTTGVKRCIAGFDWDAGSLILYPEEALQYSDEKLKEIFDKLTKDYAKLRIDYNKIRNWKG